jgi:hypothetical protein
MIFTGFVGNGWACATAPNATSALARQMRAMRENMFLTSVMPR